MWSSSVSSFSNLIPSFLRRLSENHLAKWLTSSMIYCLFFCLFVFLLMLCVCLFLVTIVFLSCSYSVSIYAFCLYSAFLPSWLCCISFILFVFDFTFKLFYFFCLFVFLWYKKYKFSLFRQTGFESRTRSRRCNDGGLPVQLPLKTASHWWAYSYKVRYWLLYYLTWKIWVDFIVLVKWFHRECGFQCKKKIFSS